MLKGTASALLVLILAGMAIGVLLMNQLPNAPTNQHTDQGPVIQNPDANRPSISLLPEAASDADQSTSPNEWAAVDAERQRLREWEQILQMQQDDLDAKLATLGARETELQNKETQIEEDLALLAAERAGLETYQGELDEREQRMQTLIRWGQITLTASATIAIVHLAVVVQRLRQRPAAATESKALRRAYLRPIKKAQGRTSHAGRQLRSIQVEGPSATRIAQACGKTCTILHTGVQEPSH